MNQQAPPAALTGLVWHPTHLPLCCLLRLMLRAAPDRAEVLRETRLQDDCLDRIGEAVEALAIMGRVSKRTGSWPVLAPGSIERRSDCMVHRSRTPWGFVGEEA